MSGAFFVLDGGPEKSRQPEAPYKKGETLANSNQNEMKSMKPLQIAARVKMKSMETHANGSKNENEEHENFCK